MTQITGKLGPQGRSEWMRSQTLGTRQSTDWTLPQYQTPHPPPPQRLGRSVASLVDVPQLPVSNIRVRARPPATYYTDEGTPIPLEWTIVPKTPTLMAAVAAGDLERDMTFKDDGAKQHNPGPSQAQQPRRHRVEAAAPPAE